MADGDPQMFYFHTANEKDLFEKAISLHIKYFRRELDEQFTVSVIDRQKTIGAQSECIIKEQIR